MAKGRIEVNQERCKGCGLCVKVCPVKILELDPKNVNHKGYQPMRSINPEKCIACAFCAMMCPDAVITVYRAIPEGSRV